MPTEPTQRKLMSNQLKEFYSDIFTTSQIKDFVELTTPITFGDNKCIVDVGGGCGHFARAVHRETGFTVKVLDSDEISIQQVNKINNKNIIGIIGDALNPNDINNAKITCFNLILHHLVGASEKETLSLQKKALLT